jgi:hypothetical protein
MRLSYGVKFEDFQTLQAPFPTVAGSNAGFKGVLVACALIAALGVFCLTQGMGLQVGGFLIGLGLVAATGVYFYEQRSVRTKKEKYEKKISEDFQRIHCRDERVFTAGENEFTASCKCGTVTRPWSELTSLFGKQNPFCIQHEDGWADSSKIRLCFRGTAHRVSRARFRQSKPRQTLHFAVFRFCLQPRRLPCGLLASHTQRRRVAPLSEDSCNICGLNMGMRGDLAVRERVSRSDCSRGLDRPASGGTSLWNDQTSKE